MWVDTYAFQAGLFYEKSGFTVFGRLDSPTPIFPRFFLKRAIGSDGQSIIVLKPAPHEGASQSGKPIQLADNPMALFCEEPQLYQTSFRSHATD